MVAYWTSLLHVRFQHRPMLHEPLPTTETNSSQIIQIGIIIDHFKRLSNRSIDFRNPQIGSTDRLYYCCFAQCTTLFIKVAGSNRFLTWSQLLKAPAQTERVSDGTTSNMVANLTFPIPPPRGQDHLQGASVAAHLKISPESASSKAYTV